MIALPRQAWDKHRENKFSGCCFQYNPTVDLAFAEWTMRTAAAWAKLVRKTPLLSTVQLFFNDHFTKIGSES